MAISWIAKRKLTYAGVFLLIVLSPIAFTIWSKWPRPSCTDGKQNQDEQGIDCSGVCPIPCVAKPVGLVVYWTKPFKIAEGKYDVSAFLENKNPDYLAENIEYNFKIFDSKGVLLANRRGSTFVNPQEKFLIFEPNIDVGKKEPARAFLDISEKVDWKFSDKEKAVVSILDKSFINEPFPKFTVKIQNKSSAEIQNLYASGILFDKDNNAFAASIAKVESMTNDEITEINFTWPTPFPELPLLNEVYLRTNLTK